MKKKKISKASKAFYVGLSYLSPKLNTRLLFYKKFGRWPDLEHPKTLNEKLLKAKLECFEDNDLVRQCADKYRVRNYVQECGYANCLNRLEAVYDSADDIRWHELPDQFAMKWNFGCGFNIICQSKRHLNIKEASLKMKNWGKEPFWAYFSELQYKNVEKKILVEECVGNEDGTLPDDYKFYCFDGKAYCVMVCVGRNEGWPKFYFFDREFQLLRINRDSVNAPEKFSLPKPEGLEYAFEIADRLSKGFPFVRIDLYLTKMGVRFGEMTFTPAAALDNKRLPETDLLFGNLMEKEFC